MRGSNRGEFRPGIPAEVRTLCSRHRRLSFGSFVSRRRLFLLSLAGIAVGIYNIVIAFIHPYPTGASTLFLALDLPVIVAVGWSFIFVGLYATVRRPQNNMGTLMT